MWPFTPHVPPDLVFHPMICWNLHGAGPISALIQRSACFFTAQRLCTLPTQTTITLFPPAFRPEAFPPGTQLLRKSKPCVLESALPKTAATNLRPLLFQAFPLVIPRPRDLLFPPRGSPSNHALPIGFGVWPPAGLWSEKRCFVSVIPHKTYRQPVRTQRRRTAAQNDISS